MKFASYSCPTERFPLLGIESETPGNNCTLLDIGSSDPALVQEYLGNETSQTATFYCDDWPAGKLWCNFLTICYRLTIPLVLFPRNTLN